MTIDRRAAVGAALVLALLAGGVCYVAWRSAAADPGDAAPLDLARTGTVLLVDQRQHRVIQVTRADPSRIVGTGPACHRAYAAAGTLVCLRPAAPMGFEVAIFGADLAQRTVLNLWGTPSRAHVSPTGRLVAWTVFHTGDSYLRNGEFSTIAGIYDTQTGTHHGSLEDYTPYLDGKPFTPEHVNYWGITISRDDHTFYATMADGGRTWLVRGDMTTRTLTAIGENIECPSLSPDGTRIAYKKRTGDNWRLTVLDLATGTHTPLAEQANVDDQPAWLDDTTIAYGRPDGVYAVPAAGSGAPALLRAGAAAPAALG